VVNQPFEDPEYFAALHQLPASSTASPGSSERLRRGVLLEGLAATDRLHGDLGFELGAVGASLAH
jgi:hypothetical protein